MKGKISRLSWEEYHGKRWTTHHVEQGGVEVVGEALAQHDVACDGVEGEVEGSREVTHQVVAHLALNIQRGTG